MKKKIIGWFSCGITSAVACKLAVEKYGKNNVVLIYIEIDSAHPDNERFISDCEKWIGVKIHRRRCYKYRDQFDVIEKLRYINGPSGARCTQELKKKVRYEVEKEISFSHQIFGFEFSKKEINRAIRFKQQYPDTKPLFPLIEAELSKERCAWYLETVGIELPAMYLLGFQNNNCIGCVKGGMGYWNKIRKEFPDVFYRMMQMEELVGRSCIKGKFLKDLKESEGRNELPVLPDCGTFCEIEFADLILPLTNKILERQARI